MGLRCFSLAVVAGLMCCSGVVTAGDGELSMMEILADEAERPGEPRNGSRPVFLDRTGGTLLFSMTAPDNAVCVRGVPDVTGDGLDEIIVGIDESGTDNVFCLSGASVGTADVVWSVETLDGVSGGAPYGDEAVVHVSDADGNGYDNILVGTAWGGRTAYDIDTLDGTIHWRFDTYLEADSGWVYSLDRMSDVTGDGVPETAFGAGSRQRLALHGRRLGCRRRPGHGRLALRGRGCGRIGAQPRRCQRRWRRRCLCRGVGQRRHLCLSRWRNRACRVASCCGATRRAAPIRPEVLPDITGDGVNEALAVIWATGGSAVRCLNGATGVEVWRSTTGHRLRDDGRCHRRRERRRGVRTSSSARGTTRSSCSTERPATRSGRRRWEPPTTAMSGPLAASRISTVTGSTMWSPVPSTSTPTP